MRDGTIARNYAEALYELGRAHGEAEAYAEAFAILDEALRTEPRVHRFLDTPQVDPGAKQALLERALDKRVPERFLRFVQVVIGKRRQRVLPEIRSHYQQILDEGAGRIHAQVTLAREPDGEIEEVIARRLSVLLDKKVTPHITVNPAILGGLVVRFGDRAINGSLRRQLVSLKREMMHAYMPEFGAERE
ncbi:MAG: ATP synthase F1 subunit delta [Gemmatimonadota bacterium]